jgi:hypothetical protein
MVDTESNQSGDLAQPTPPAKPQSNRPATGAREASALPAHATHASLEATDFLGLDQDVAAATPARPPASGDVPGLETWLFKIESSDGHEQRPGGRAGQRPARGASAGDDGESAPELPASFGRPRRSPLRWLAAVAVLGLAAAGAWMARGQLDSGTTPEVALQPAPVRPAPQEPPRVDPVVPAVATAPTETVPIETVLEPAPEPQPEPQVALEPPPVEPAPEIVRVDPPTGLAPLRSESFGQDSVGPGGGRRVNEQDLSGLWLEATIPLQAIDGPRRLRTIDVGRVRILLHSGEHLEGDLYAVGLSRVWLEVPLGRVSFAMSDVKELTHIVAPAGATAVKTQTLADLPRVEVLLPGGALMGRVLERNGSIVTLVTDEGMRLRVDALDIRVAPSGRSRLVGATSQLDS